MTTSSRSTCINSIVRPVDVNGWREARKWLIEDTAIFPSSFPILSSIVLKSNSSKDNNSSPILDRWRHHELQFYKLVAALM